MASDLHLLLGAFGELRKAAIGFFRLSVHIEKLGSDWYLKIFVTSVEKGDVPLKSGKNNGYFV
jgi:hypothetical protein